MSYPLERYNANNVVSTPDRTSIEDRDVFRSFFDHANRLMGEMGRDGSSTFLSSDSKNPNVKVFGVSSMNVTQISRGPDGRPRVVQAQDERRMGPGGVWQTKKALRDPDRGIDRMQVGYFVGNQGEIVERQLDPVTGQYRQQIQRRGVPSDGQNFSNQWRIQAQQAMQRPAVQHQQQALPPPQTSYYEDYPQQQQPYQYY